MRKNYALLLLVILYSITLNSQITDTLYIGFTKSIYLVFQDQPIHHANSEDEGVEEIIVKTMDNKLIITAAIENFEETNMFVQDGENMYLFLLRYSINPKKYLYNYQSPQKKPSVSIEAANPTLKSSVNNSANENIVLVDEKLLSEKQNKQQEKIKTENTFESNSIMVLNEPQKIYSKGVNLGKMSLIATNFYVIEDRFYLKLVLNNKSKINYEIDFERFIIKNKSKSIKKSADQFLELKPLFVKNDQSKTVLPKSKNEYVFVFEKFTIQDNKKLTIEVWEKNGDRTLEFSFYAEDILKIDNL